MSQHPNTRKVLAQLRLPLEAEAAVDEILMAHEQALDGIVRRPRLRYVLAAGKQKGLACDESHTHFSPDTLYW